MSMALSGGGGLTGGMGMGMAYQAPPPVHTAPSINHGAGMPSIADGLTTEDRAKETLTQTTRIVSFDPVSSSTKNNQVSVVDEDGEFNIKARKGLNLNSLSLRVSDDVVAYKALKKYIKKGSNIAKVIQTCVGKPVDGVPGSIDFITFEDLAKFCTSTNPDGTPPKLSTLTKSPLVELKPLPQPNGNMKYGLAIKIHPTESPIVALPEEILGLQFGLALASLNENQGAFEIALPVPSNFTNSAREALLDAVNTSGSVNTLASGNFFPRHICALVGMFQQISDTKSSHIKTGNGGDYFLATMKQEIKVLQSSVRKNGLANAGQLLLEEEQPIIMMVTTSGRFSEVNLVRLEEIATKKQHDISLVKNYITITSQSSMLPNSVGEMAAKCLKSLQTVMPGRGVSAVIIYSREEDSTVQNTVSALQSSVPTLDDESRFFEATSETVSVGTAFLAAAKDQRIAVDLSYSDALGCAVGVKFDFGDGKESIVQTVCDFDDRIPAGPKKIEFNSAEIACMREKRCMLHNISEEDANSKKFKNVDLREEVAKMFTCKIVQKRTRDGVWEEFYDDSNEARVLCRTVEETGDMVACNSSTLSIEVGANSMITKKFSEGREIRTVTNEAASTKRLWWLLSSLLIVVLAGLGYRSYSVTVLFDKNVRKLQAYYKHVNVTFKSQSKLECQYIVYRYRDNTTKLWKMLEKKYNDPVLEWWEYPEREEVVVEEEVDLDTEKGEEGGNGNEEL